MHSESKQREEKKKMAENKKSSKKLSGTKLQIILLIVCPVLMIAVCSVLVWFYATIAVDEESFSLPKAQALPTTQLSTQQDAAAYFTDVLRNACESGEVSISLQNKVSVSDIAPDMNDAANSLLKFAVEGLTGDMAAMFAADKIAYGEKAELISSDVADKASEITFEEDEENKLHKIELLYTLPDKNIADGFFADEDSEVFSLVEEQLKSICDIKSNEKILEHIKIYAEIDFTSDKLQFMKISRLYSVGADVEFIGDLSVLGTTHTDMCVLLEREYSVSFAGIEIQQDEIILNSNGYDNLSVLAGVDENAGADEFSLSFTSSDEAVVTVDEKGVVEAVSVSEAPAIITAELNYLGKTYKDEVKVFVVVEAESVSLDKRSLEMKAGESFTLTATVKPKKATIKDVQWYSLDESVATVDENGFVTAIAAGETKIVAVSVSGAKTVSCTLKVTQ